ncbi:hypothetical protein [Nesterenkonia halotolerans]|uniref:Lipoprotein n=1 Tax=Nesterenkonia halotolerans TaxID=225325 RepID=A0ABR9J2Z9_9MICC|nr:hypothetical protein [Nesterenkonia halotolerans]MBE1513280.1 hypothetical protein [Nesterenkonia halotolerans]
MASKYSIAILAVAGLALASVSGCAGPYRDLDEDSLSEREVPDSLPEYALEDFDHDTTRWVGEYKEDQLWLSEGTATRSVCLLVYPDDENWIAGCGGLQLGLGRGAGAEYLVLPDDTDPPSDATAISSNVYVLGD